MNKETLNILVDSLTDEEWNAIKLNRESRQAFQKADIFRAKRESAIQFADWILNHTVHPSYDDDGFACWTAADGTGEIFTSLDLYNIYLTGQWEEDLDDEDDAVSPT